MPHGSGTLWSSPGCTGPGPCPFDIVYTFSTPFLYSPSQGNLLVDFQATGLNGTGTGQFDVANYFADPATAAVDEITFVGASPSATGNQEYSDSVTEFFYTPAVATTPEPPGSLLLGTGLLVLAGVLRRRRAAAGRCSPADTARTIVGDCS